MALSAISDHTVVWRLRMDIEDGIDLGNIPPV
jgi:hypothetical protein